MIDTTFANLYHDWAIALAIDSFTPGGGKYNLENIDFTLDLGEPGSPNPEAYDTPGAPPWGTDYIWLNSTEELSKLSFNGEDFSLFNTSWTSDGDVLYSGTGDLIDNWAIFETTGGGVLMFDTYWDIEDYWDFGFIQISTDGGYTWTSLDNAYTTFEHDPNAHPTVVANLPGLTGWSGAWVNMEFDLSAYPGDIMIAFRYVTDWATTYEGWYIDNVYVNGTLISDGSDASVFKDITEIIPIDNDFTVSIIGIKEKAKGNPYKVFTLEIDDATEDALFQINKVLKTSDKALMLVTFDAPQGFTGYANYEYELVVKEKGPK
jgi:bacillopeptidase F (M6 metalloprotease family)